MRVSAEAWTLHNPVRICFGRGIRKSLAAALADRRTLIVCSSRGRLQLESDPLLSGALRGAKRLVWMDAVETNPDLHRLQDLVLGWRGVQVDCVVAFGGGSAIDSAKAFALALSPIAQHHSLRDLLGAAPKFPVGASLPLYALPTTAGTGSEVTPYATVWDKIERKKISLAGPAVYPHSAFVDPELSDNVPYGTTLHTGLDAVNQAAESIWNRNMTPLSEMFAHRALQLGTTALPKLLNDLGNPSLRDTMSEVSLLAGLAISQTRTSLCHSISYPLTAHFGLPHGLACAFSMSAVLRYNLSADDGRFVRLAKVLSHDEEGKTEALFQLFCALSRQLNVGDQVRGAAGSLAAVLRLRDQMLTPGRAENNLAAVDDKAIESILTESWEG